MSTFVFNNLGSIIEIKKDDTEINHIPSVGRRKIVQNSANTGFSVMYNDLIIVAVSSTDIVKIGSSTLTGSTVAIIALLDAVLGPTVAGGAVLLTPKVSMATAEILAGNTTPKVLATAAGAGTIIQPISAVFNYTYGSTTYATNLSGQIRYAGVTGNATTTTILGATESTVVRQLCSTANTFLTATNSPINKDLIFDIATGNPVTGNGTLDIYVSYVVITL